MFKKYLHILRRKLAKIWLEINLQLTVVGVTGSYGKTSAVRTIAEVLAAKYSVNRTDIDLDTIYNLPDTILRTKIWNDFLVLEYGVDHIGEMDQHLSLVKPKIAVLTGITPVHTDKELLGSLSGVISEKLKLINSLPQDGLAIFNYDDEEVRKAGLNCKRRKVFYGLDKKADVWADNISLSLQKTQFELHDGSEVILIKTKLLGYPAVYACLVAYIIGKEQGIKKEKIVQKLSELKPLEGRFSVCPGPLGTILINDAKRANPASTIAGLRSLSLFPGRKIAVLGEMGELGDSSVPMHQKVGREVVNCQIDLLLGVGPLAKYIVEEAKKNGLKESYFASDVNAAAEILRKNLKSGDLLYLKASLLRHLERIILILQNHPVKCKKTSCHNYSPCDTCKALLQ